MKLLDVAIYAGIVVFPIVISLLPRAPQPIPENAILYMHIKHAPPYPATMGKVRQIYNTIQSVNRTGLSIGLEPQVVADWATQLEYYKECGDIPVMLNVLTSDDAVQLSIQQIQEAMNVCNVRWLRFHEAVSYFNPFPTTYVNEVMAFAQATGVPIFWSEWDIYTFPFIASVIQNYQDVVAVSFGTNGVSVEPAEGFALLSQFQRRGASVQSWYWWEKNGRQDGSELNMPPALMRQHTSEAFQAGCEVVQYEPYAYFFSNETPRTTLSTVLNGSF